MAAIATKMFRPAAIRSLARTCRIAGNVPSMSFGATRFMSGRKYMESHEWALDNGDGTATVGISDYAASSLGDAVFCDLPEIGDEVEPGEIFGLVESVKAASDIYSPVTGEVVEVNEALEDSPELLNEDPTGKGWIVKFKMTDGSELDSLMDEDTYKQSIEDI